MRSGIHSGLQVPAIRAFDLVEQFGVVFLTARTGLVPGDPVQQVRCPGRNILLHSLIASQFEFLRQVADAQAAAPENFPGIRSAFAGQNFKQAGFPTTVAADEANLFAGRHGECDLRQQGRGPIGQG